ncbi:MAG TPA: hypothetical protein PKC39_06465 [Ferruginibacter sp.]|nr:hypothetical protein [Ferruginibacter sp.]HMP20581.1 hypothetical protein [Ferruginibacter sp.]
MKIKNVALTVLISLAATFAYAQKDVDDESEGGFKKEHLFTGGTINLSFFGSTTVLGATPQLGYSVTSWMDAGIVMGYTYISQRYANNDKLRQTLIGPGAFVRLFPVNFLFATAQFEHNFIRYKYIYNTGGNEKLNLNVSSLLVGAGYSSQRMGRNSPYYYFSVSVDVLQNPNSPYTDQFNNLLPVVNAGFNIPLFQGSRK